MPRVDSPLTVRLPLLEREETILQDWEIDCDYLTPTDGFSFTLYHPDRSRLRGLEMQPVELLVAGQSQLLGRIDSTSIGDDGTAIRCQGRDFLADLTECNVDPSFTVKEGQNVQETLRSVMSPCGIDVIADLTDGTLQKVRSGAPLAVAGQPKRFVTQKLTDYKPEAGESIFEFCNKIVARLGATIQPGLARDQIFIGAPSYDIDPPWHLIRTDRDTQGKINTILRATAVRDFSSFPTYTLFTGNVTKKGEQTKPARSEISSVEYATNDELERIFTYGITGSRRKPLENKETLGDGRLYRLLTLNDKAAKNSEQVEAAMRRAIAERLKDTLVYTCTLPGHTDAFQGAVWTVDVNVRVDDDVCDVHENLWIARRTLRFSAREGATAELVCWRPGSFIL